MAGSAEAGWESGSPGTGAAPRRPALRAALTRPDSEPATPANEDSGGGRRALAGQGQTAAPVTGGGRPSPVTRGSVSVAFSKWLRAGAAWGEAAAEGTGIAHREDPSVRPRRGTSALPMWPGKLSEQAGLGGRPGRAAGRGWPCTCRAQTRARGVRTRSLGKTRLGCPEQEPSWHKAVGGRPQRTRQRPPEGAQEAAWPRPSLQPGHTQDTTRD